MKSIHPFQPLLRSTARRHVLFLLALLPLLSGCQTTSSIRQADSLLQPGDVIFQDSRSAQSPAIKAATGSPLTHCGILVKQGSQFCVAEAGNPVRVTHDLRTLEQWVASGSGGRAWVKRVRGGLTPAQQSSLAAAMRGMEGKPYDTLFQWNNRRIYCSEFVYQAYLLGPRITLGKVQQFQDLNLSSPVVKDLILRRYTEQGIEFKKEEPVITPVAVSEAAALETVTTLMAP